MPSLAYLHAADRERPAAVWRGRAIRGGWPRGAARSASVGAPPRPWRSARGGPGGWARGWLGCREEGAVPATAAAAAGNLADRA